MRQWYLRCIAAVSRTNHAHTLKDTRRLLRSELKPPELSANRLALDLGVPSGRIADILNERRSISADTAFRLGRYFGKRPQFWLDLQSQYDLAVIERERGAEIEQRVRPADAA